MKTFKEDYDRAPLVLKRAIVLELLDALRPKGDIFKEFFQFISETPEKITEFELDEIFRVILSAIYIETSEKTIQAEKKLSVIKNSISSMRERERNERIEEESASKIESHLSLI